MFATCTDVTKRTKFAPIFWERYICLKTKNYSWNPITNTWKHLDMYSRTVGSFTSKCNAYLALSIASRLSKNVLATYYIIFQSFGRKLGQKLFPREIVDRLHKVQESGHDEEVFKRFKETWWKWDWERALSFVSTHTRILQKSKNSSFRSQIKVLEVPSFTNSSNYIFVSTVLTHM